MNFYVHNSRYGGSGSKSPVPVVYMGSSGSNDSLLMAPPMGSGPPRSAVRATQTDLSRDEIASLESKSNHDLEQRDFKIDELQRSSEELRRQISSQQKVRHFMKSSLTFPCGSTLVAHTACRMGHSIFILKLFKTLN